MSREEAAAAKTTTTSDWTEMLSAGGYVDADADARSRRGCKEKESKNCVIREMLDEQCYSI